MQRHVWVAAVGLLLATSRAALARDPLALVCSGVARPTDDAERVGLSINYYDVRASDGSSRRVALRELWGDIVFKWSKVIGGDLDRREPIVLQAGKLVRFRGTYMLTKDGAAFFLVLVGKLSRHPIDDKALHPIDVKLPCVDISI